MGNRARIKDYSDLDLDFIAHPTTKDVVKKTGVDAIKRSVRNLIFTNFYDRPFRSWIGSNARKMLFENVNPMTASYLKGFIIETIENLEPRVKLYSETGIPDGVMVKFNPDNNGYEATIAFTVVNTNEPAVISLFLERLR